jgi:rhomboid protease GluP
MAVKPTTPPAFSADVSLGPLTPEQALMLAGQLAQRQGWTVGHLSAAGLMADDTRDPFGPPARLTVLLRPGALRLSSTAPAQQGISPDEASAAARERVQELLRAYEDACARVDPAPLQQQYELARPGFVPPHRDVLAQQAPGAGSGLLAAFRPVKGYVVTPVLIGVNVAVFLLMVATGANILLPSSETLLTWGANVRPLTLGGEWWRLLTACFVHIGVLHLLLNMYALRNIGAELEPGLGPWRLLVAYLLAGIGASMVSLWWHDQQPVISAGASGAIFGLFGLFLALLTTSLLAPEVRKPLLASLGTFIAYNLLFGLAPGIDNAAHIGGLLTGLVVGYALFPTLRRGAPGWLQPVVLVGVSALLLVAGAWVLRRLPNDPATYAAGIEQFWRAEEQSLQQLRGAQNLDRPRALSVIEQSGVRRWQQQLALVERLDSLRLPVEQHQYNLVLRQYSLWRLRGYRLLYRSVQQNAAAPPDSLPYYLGQAESLRRALRGGQAAGK